MTRDPVIRGYDYFDQLGRDQRVALLQRERIAWGGTLGFALACFVCVLVGFWLAVGHS